MSVVSEPSHCKPMSLYFTWVVGPHTPRVSDRQSDSVRADLGLLRSLTNVAVDRTATSTVWKSGAPSAIYYKTQLIRFKDLI